MRNGYIYEPSELTILTFQKAVKSFSMFSELREAPATYESIARILGYPTIEVNPDERGKQCSNCGSHEHTCESCTLPKMDQLLEKFGANCYDSTPNAVEAKRKVVSELYGAS